MPSMNAMLDNNLPTFDGRKSLPDRVQAIEGYIYQLLEQLRYSWRNIDPSVNFNTAAAQKYEETITGPIKIRIEDTEGNINELNVTAKGLQMDLYGEGGTSGKPAKGSVKWTAQEFQQFYGEGGDWTKLQQTAEGLVLDMYGENGTTGNPAIGSAKWAATGFQQFFKENGAWTQMQQTVNGFKFDLYGTDGDSGDPAEGSILWTAKSFNSFMSKNGTFSQVQQQANKISWLVKSGTSSSNFTMTDRAMELATSNLTLTAKGVDSGGGSYSQLTLSSGEAEITSANISFNGLVRFTDLNTTGTPSETFINGGLIKAGSTIMAPTIAWGDAANMQGAYGFLTYGKGYNDYGVTDIVALYSMFGIKIKCSNQDSGINLDAYHVWCTTDANAFMVIYNKKSTSLVSLINQLIEAAK